MDRVAKHQWDPGSHPGAIDLFLVRSAHSNESPVRCGNLPLHEDAKLWKFTLARDS
jgi:hypothetical protein